MDCFNVARRPLKATNVSYFKSAPPSSALLPALQSPGPGKGAKENKSRCICSGRRRTPVREPLFQCRDKVAHGLRAERVSSYSKQHIVPAGRK
ncbi:coiled-coil domain-containing protein 80 [Anopheles sinensis]|uniref:Coiled-coil domain-containing protein 80 n=1 Tax=Anopheles sinensis TaxID=74873 RepID=A0A084WLM9_ANOSI|nr:coiled-coil domain-containing protein 80 [Anopheles sinensis]